MVVPENGFIRLPPDSTGKKSAAAGRLILQCQDNTTYTFEVGQTIQGQTSSATAEIVGFQSDGYTAGQIDLYCDLNTLVGTFQANENILVGPTVYAKTKTTATLDQIYYQKINIVDRDTPSHNLKIDRAGDAFVRFNEGSPAVSTFGNIITDNPESSRQYVYAYDEKPNEFYDVTAGSGTLTYVSGERSVLLDTNGIASGDLVTRQSHLYHPYHPGTSLKIVQTVVVGDVGKANVRRRWGYFDANNGIFWELDGTTLYLVIRSDTTGSVVDTRIAQTDWNQDQLDGTRNFNLDITKANVYWLDIQWLGVGIVRCGVYEEDGRRTTCHIFNNPNTNSTVYMRQATLPIRFECENTNTAVSSSELKNICSVVQVIGSIKRQLSCYGASSLAPVSIGPSDGETPILALRSKTTVNGLNNHGLTFPTEVHVISDNDSSGIFNIRIRNLCFTAGGTFNSVNDSSHSEYNYQATGFLTPSTSGTTVYSAMVKGNDMYDHQFENFTPYTQHSLVTTVLADGTTRPEIAVTVEPMTATSTGNFYISVNFDEMVY